MTNFLKIKTILVKLYLEVLFVIQCVKRFVSSFFVPKPIFINNIQLGGPTLIIAPHADDELIGCYNYIKRHRDDVIVLYCGLLGSNKDTANARIRKDEFIEFCSKVSAQYVVLEKASVESIKAILCKYDFDNVFIPSFIDWHVEHRWVNEALLQILEQIKLINIVWYQVSVPLYKINYIEGENKADYLEKWRVFADCYKSQKKINTSRFKFVERRGWNHFYAIEPYYCQSPDVFKQNLGKLSKNTIQLNQLKKVLNDYGKVVGLSAIIYKQID